MTRRTHYQVLGLNRTAAQAQIAAAYRRALFRCHPDLFPNNPEKVADFKAVTAAYRILSNPERRRDYDWWLVHNTHRDAA